MTRIFIRHESGLQHAYDINVYDSVQSLKEMVVAREGVEPSK